MANLTLAIELARGHGLSLSDASVLVSAQSAGCGVLWSEDRNDGQRFDGVVVRNPFAAADPPTAGPPA